MKIVFMGTPDFAVPSLKRLIEEYGVEAVFTQPDKPKGRGKKMAFSPVKEVAVEHDIIVIPKSTHKERMMENFNVFDFSLAPDDMAAIAALDTAKTLFFSHYDPEMVKWLINYGK